MTEEQQGWDLDPQGEQQLWDLPSTLVLRAECNRCHRFVAECWRHGGPDSIEEYRWDTRGAKCKCSPTPALPQGDALQHQLVRRARKDVEVLKVRVR